MATLADLTVTIGGDTKGFTDAIDDATGGLSLFDKAVTEAVASGSTLAEAIASAMGSAAIAVSDSTGDITESLAAIGSSSVDASNQLSLFTGVLDGIPFADATGQLNLFTDELEQLSNSSGTANSSLESISEGTQSFSDAALNAASSLSELSDAEDSAAEHTNALHTEVESAWESLVAFGEALAVTEALKEFGEEALQTFGEVQQATIAMTALTGSAEKANESIEALKGLAISDALSFPALVTADLRMTAFGFDAEQIPVIMQAAADAAAATNQSFDKVVSAIDRMALSGTAGAKQLATLGISAQALGDEMDVTAAQVTKAFKALDQSDRLIVLEGALSKFAGTSQQTAAGIVGQWQNLKTETEFAMEGIGEAIAPMVTNIVHWLNDDLLPAITDTITGFRGLPGPVQETVVALGLLSIAIPAGAVLIGGLGLGVQGLSTTFKYAGEVIALTSDALGTLYGVVATGIAEGGALVGLGTVLGGIGIALATIHFTGLDNEFNKWCADLDLNTPAILKAAQAILYLKNLLGNTPENNAAANAGFMNIQPPSDSSLNGGVDPFAQYNSPTEGSTAVNAAAKNMWSGISDKLTGAAEELSQAGRDQITAALAKKTKGTSAAGLKRLQALEDNTQAMLDLAQFRQSAGLAPAGPQEPTGGGTGFQPGTVNTPNMFAPGTELTPEEFDNQQAMLGDLDALNMSILGHVLNVQGAWDGVGTSLAGIGQLEYEAETAALLYQQDLDRINAQWNLVSDTALTAIGQIEDALSKDLATGLVDVIDGTKNVGAAFITMGETIAKTVLTTIIQGALTPLFNIFDSLITQIPVINNLLNFGTLTNPNPTGNQITGPLGHGTPNPNAPADPGLPPNTAAVNADSTAVGTNTAGIGANTTAEGLNTAALIALTAVLGASLVKSLLGGIGKSTSTMSPTDPLPPDPAYSPVPTDGGAGSGSQSGASNLGTEALLMLGTAMTVNTAAIIANSAAITAQIVSTDANIAMGNVIVGSFGAQTAVTTTQVGVDSSLVTTVGADTLAQESALPDYVANTGATLGQTAATGAQTVATGAETVATGADTVATGGDAIAVGTDAVAEGADSVALAANTLALGAAATASAMQAAADAAGGAGGLGGLLGGITSALGGLGSVVGIGVSIASGIVMGDELAQLNNKVWTLVSSNQGILNQIVDLQNSANLYWPDLVHLVDIWNELITTRVVLDQDLRDWGGGSSAADGAGAGQVTSSVISENTDAVNRSGVATSDLKGGIANLGAILQKQALAAQGNVGGPEGNAFQLASAAGSSGITGAASAAAVAQLLQQLPTGGQGVAPAFTTSTTGGGSTLTPAQIEAMLGGYQQTALAPNFSPPPASTPNYAVTDPGFQATPYGPVNMNPSAYAPSVSSLVGQNTPGTVTNYNNSFTLAVADNTSRSMANGLVTALRQRGMSIR